MPTYTVGMCQEFVGKVVEVTWRDPTNPPTMQGTCIMHVETVEVKDPYAYIVSDEGLGVRIDIITGVYPTLDVRISTRENGHRTCDVYDGDERIAHAIPEALAYRMQHMHNALHHAHAVLLRSYILTGGLNARTLLDVRRALRLPERITASERAIYNPRRHDARKI